MALLDVVTMDNEKAGSVELPAAVFEAPVRPHLHHAEVRRQLAGRRQGTHATKNRSAVSGGGSKPWRQKGTGRARQGSTRSPQWEGGGVVFGPVPRDHAHSLPKRVRRAALRSALSQRLREGAVTVVDRLAVEDGKTRRAAEALRALGLAGDSVLIVLEGPEEGVERATRNLPAVRTLRAEGLNVRDVLWASRLLLTRGAVDAIQARLGAAPQEEGA